LVIVTVSGTVSGVAATAVAAMAGTRSRPTTMDAATRRNMREPNRLDDTVLYLLKTGVQDAPIKPRLATIKLPGSLPRDYPPRQAAESSQHIRGIV
jgi:hypothetical protein